MRSALLGVVFGDNPRLLEDFVSRCTRITHTDPKAYHGALAVAVAAHLSATAAQIKASQYIDILTGYLGKRGSEEFLELIRRAIESASRCEGVSDFAVSIGSRRGISGYIYHTVPCVIQTWLRFPEDFRSGLSEIISAGGDADTSGAILGGLIGARVGKEGIGEELISGLFEWPRSVAWMEQLGAALDSALRSGGECSPVSVFVPGVLFRNMFFTAVVIAHGMRRLLPPY